jgi:hypothetical protein
MTGAAGPFGGGIVILLAFAMLVQTGYAEDPAVSVPEAFN